MFVTSVYEVRKFNTIGKQKMSSMTYLFDKKLSFRAKGLLTYCLSQGEDFKYDSETAVKSSKEGRDAVNTAINELIKNGYCDRTILRNQGKTAGVSYAFYATKKEGTRE